MRTLMSGSAGWPRRGRLNGRVVPPTNEGPASGFFDRSGGPDRPDRPSRADDPDLTGHLSESERTATDAPLDGGLEPDADESGNLRLVLHVPFVVANLAEGAVVGRMLARSLRSAAAEESVEVDVAEATITIEGDQADHRRLFCDRLIGPGRRCVLREGHSVPCHPGRVGAA